MVPAYPKRFYLIRINFIKNNSRISKLQYFVSIREDLKMRLIGTQHGKGTLFYSVTDSLNTVELMTWNRMLMNCAET